MANERETEPSMGFTDAVAATVKEIAGGLQATGLGAVWDGAKDAFNQGAHELASALFTGSGYVQYGGRGGQEDAQPSVEVQSPEVTQAIEALKQPNQQPEMQEQQREQQQEQSRGGLGR